MPGGAGLRSETFETRRVPAARDLAMDATTASADVLRNPGHTLLSSSWAAAQTVLCRGELLRDLEASGLKGSTRCPRFEESCIVHPIVGEWRMSSGARHSKSAVLQVARCALFFSCCKLA